MNREVLEVLIPSKVGRRRPKLDDSRRRKIWLEWGCVEETPLTGVGGNGGHIGCHIEEENADCLILGIIASKHLCCSYFCLSWLM